MHFPWFWLGLALVIIGVIIFLLAANYYNSAGVTESQKNNSSVWMWVGGFVFVVGLIVMVWNFVLADAAAACYKAPVRVRGSS